MADDADFHALAHEHLDDRLELEGLELAPARTCWRS